MKLTDNLIDRDGFLLLRNQLDSKVIEHLIQDLERIHKRSEKNSAGLRNLLNLIPSINTLAQSELLCSVVETAGVTPARCVRGVYFDKKRDSNWKVAWHQDLTIAVKRRIDVSGFSAWTMKAGIQHVQPPVNILEQMIAVRIHLDDADESNGCLRVIPGSHRSGRLTAEQITRWRSEVDATSCVVKQGDFLVMRPLLLHASSVAELPSHRRVIHLEYASIELAGGLEWYDAQ